MQAPTLQLQHGLQESGSIQNMDGRNGDSLASKGVDRGMSESMMCVSETGETSFSQTCLGSYGYGTYMSNSQDYNESSSRQQNLTSKEEEKNPHGGRSNDRSCCSIRHDGEDHTVAAAGGDKAR